MQLPGRQPGTGSQIFDGQSFVMMFADVVDRRIDQRHRLHRSTLAFVTADNPHHTDHGSAGITDRVFVGDEPVQNAVFVVPQFHATDDRLPRRHHLFVVSLEVVGSMLRKEIVVRTANNCFFRGHTQVLPERLAGADHTALPILHKKVNSGKMFKELLKLLRPTHFLKEFTLNLRSVSRHRFLWCRD